RQTLNLLQTFAGLLDSQSTRSIVFRLLANVLLQVPLLRERWQPDDTLYDSYEFADITNEFIIGRIFFLSTISCRSYDSGALARLVETVKKHLYHHVTTQWNAEIEGAFMETCKVAFNLLHFFPDTTAQMIRSVPCSGILMTLPLSISHKSSTSYVINILLCFNCTEKSVTGLSSLAIDILEVTLSNLETTMSQSVFHESTLVPLFSLLENLYTSGDQQVKEFFHSRILATDGDRELPIGKAPGTLGQLLRATNSPNYLQLRDAIYCLLWTISNENTSVFVENIGLGYASGFLVRNGLPMPSDAASATSYASTGVNPVTGQKAAAEQRDFNKSKSPELADMTDEEKEREAERLFVLFERYVNGVLLADKSLRTNGIISAENPLRSAVESGQLEYTSDPE
ncbi:guanine nucleotide exchange factor, partial [Dipodascopsis tothii]|uniref:guanine nucleotide exchange factor n=1 Tax=Dipodascopsis tothii TaxID=44089 RepID=UPI0034CFDCE0